MQFDYKIKYGNSFYDLDDVAVNVRILSCREPDLKIDINIFQDKLNTFFSALILEKKSVLIIISDKTRLCGYPEYLPILNSFLTNRKVSLVTYIIGYGTHKKQTEQESILSYGDVYENHNFIHPETNDSEKYKDLGLTSFGTSVKIRKEVFEHDIIITFGALSHHYFAGYGGGRKLIFPGLSLKKSIFQNHSLFLDKKEKCLNQYCGAGILNNNPIASDLKEVNDKLPQYYSIHGILNSKGQVCDLILGSKYEDFKKACAKLDDSYKIENEESFDVLLASCGGYPKDINFIQSHKGLHNAASFVKNNGVLIVFAECRDGIGSDTFLPYFEMGYQKAFNKLVGSYKGNGGTALAMMEKTKRIRIKLVSSLTEEDCSLIGVEKITFEKAKEYFSELMGEKAIIDNAGMLIKSSV